MILNDIVGILQYQVTIQKSNLTLKYVSEKTKQINIFE